MLICPPLIIFPRNVSFREYYVLVRNAAAAASSSSSAAALQFKLRSSNLTHALFIQISRTSSITDIVVQSKMAAGGNFVKKIQNKARQQVQKLTPQFLLYIYIGYRFPLSLSTIWGNHLPVNFMLKFPTCISTTGGFYFL